MDPPYRRNRRSQRRSSSPESNSAPNRASTSPSRRFRRSPSARPQYRFEAHHQGAEHSPLVASLLNNSRPLSRDDFNEWTNRFRNAVSLASPSPPRRLRAEYRNWLPRDRLVPVPLSIPCGPPAITEDTQDAVTTSNAPADSSFAPSWS